jgi:glycosyltransferase involved in cell wall biosynthesis
VATGMTPASVVHLIRPQAAGNVGGADLHLIDLVEQQVGSGMRVTVLALGNDDYQRRLAARGALLAKVPPWWHPMFFPAFARLLRDEAVDIVHGHGYSADLAAVLGVRLTRCVSKAPALTRRPAVVLTVHGFIRSTWSTRIRTAINEQCLRFADVIIATSRPETAHLTRMLPASDVYYIPNGIRMPAASDPRERAEPPRHLAFVGRLEPEKRPDLFLSVAARIAASHPDLRVTVIGAGSLARSLRSQAERLGIADKCTFTGLVADVDQRLSSVDVLVALSDSEGTPRAVLEAMAASVTVVATAVGGVPDLIADGRTGVLVPAGPVAAVAAERIQSLLADPPRLRAIGHAASQAVRSEFLVEDMAKRTLAAYDAVLSERSRSR